MQFSDLGLSESTLLGIRRIGFDKPTKIQSLAIPKILSKSNDLIGIAQTGSGKTAAFGLPLIDMLQINSRVAQALILAPTRELAIQITDELNNLRYYKELNIISIHGGVDILRQTRQLQKGVDIVVGTPGRVLDLIFKKKLTCDFIKYLVLDEADEMLSRGFIDDVEKIMKKSSPRKRTFLFSATFPDKIKQLCNLYMNEPETIKTDDAEISVKSIEQIYYKVDFQSKFDTLCYVLENNNNDFYAMVFCKTKLAVEHISNKLKDKKFMVGAISGDLSQTQRDLVTKQFRSKEINILVTTDISARGIDIDNLTHVINYSLPDNQEIYTHRIGRTGRVGKIGIAITIITPSEQKKLKNLQEQLNFSITSKELPEKLKELQTKNKASQSKRNKTKLFVSMGTKDGIDANNLMNRIFKETGINRDNILDIAILENFSFITTTAQDAELILNSFRNIQNQNNSPLIIKAKKQSAKRKNSSQK